MLELEKIEKRFALWYRPIERVPKNGFKDVWHVAIVRVWHHDARIEYLLERVGHARDHCIQLFSGCMLPNANPRFLQEFRKYQNVNSTQWIAVELL